MRGRDPVRRRRRAGHARGDALERAPWPAYPAARRQGPRRGTRGAASAAAPPSRPVSGPAPVSKEATMRALVIDGPGTARGPEAPVPVPAVGQVVVDVRRA